MPYYIAPYIGAGTDGKDGTVDDPFRPRTNGQPDWSAIDLRPDGGATLGGGGLNACLLYLPVTDSDPKLTEVAGGKDESLALATRNGIESKLGLSSLSATRWGAIVGELMTAPPVNGWNAIASGVRRSRFEILLGPRGAGRRPEVIYSERVAPSRNSQSLTESWPTNQTTISSGQDNAWTEENEDSEVSGGKLRPVSTALAIFWATLDTAMDTVNHEHNFTANMARNAGFSQALPSVRHTDLDNSYRSNAQRNTSTDKRELLKRATGGTTLLDGDTTDPGAGDITVMCSADGSTILGTVGALALSATDTTLTGGTTVAVGLVSTGNVGDATADSHNMFDLISVPVMRRRSETASAF